MDSRLISRSVYKKPLSKLVGQDIDIPMELMKKCGKLILEEVRKEIKKDASKVGAMGRAVGKPVPLPDSKEFVMSFKYQVKNRRIEITSDWPFSELHTEGKRAYPMVWLTQQRGVSKVPMVNSSGIVLVRTTPLNSDQAWIHPGFLKYNFLERGVQKGRERAAAMLAEELALKILAQTDLFL
jgi:hypothetical protein